MSVRSGERRFGPPRSHEEHDRGSVAPWLRPFRPQACNGQGWQSCSARDVRSQMTNILELFLRREHRRPAWVGLPVPCRRTLAAALQASARSKLPALRHPWLRWPATPALRARAPLPEYRVVMRSRNGRLVGGNTRRPDCGPTRISRAEHDRQGWHCKPPLRVSVTCPPARMPALWRIGRTLAATVSPAGLQWPGLALQAAVTRQRNVPAGPDAGVVADRSHLGCDRFARRLAMARAGIASRRYASA